MLMWTCGTGVKLVHYACYTKCTIMINILCILPYQILSSLFVILGLPLLQIVWHFPELGLITFLISLIGVFCQLLFRYGMVCLVQLLSLQNSKYSRRQQTSFYCLLLLWDELPYLLSHCIYFLFLIFLFILIFLAGWFPSGAPWVYSH